jgi:fluoride exporter
MEFARTSDAGRTALLLMTPTVNAAGVFFLLGVGRMEKLLWLAAAGVLGTLARYGVGLGIKHIYSGNFPLGTLIVNASGCLLFGLVWSLAEGRLHLHPDTRTIVLVGFMGAFTTFSTYMFETSTLMQESRWLLALANFTAQNALGILSLFAGLALGRLI